MTYSPRFSFDPATNQATIILDPKLPTTIVNVPVDIVRANKISSYVIGFYPTGEDVNRIISSDSKQKKIVLYVSSNTLQASPDLTQILNKCKELNPIRFTWTSVPTDPTINECFYDYRFNADYVSVIKDRGLNTRKFILELQNKSTLNEMLRISNIAFLVSGTQQEILSPYVVSLKTPTSLAQIENFVNGDTGIVGVQLQSNTFIVKPIYGFQESTRIYDRKEYTNVPDLVADIITEHGTLDAFFEMQKNENEFVWSQETQQNTPVFIQCAIPVDQEFTFVFAPASPNLRIISSTQDISLSSEDLARLIDLMTQLILLNSLNTSLITVRGIVSNGKFYLIDLSESMFPELTMQGTSTDVTQLANLLFSVLTE